MIEPGLFDVLVNAATAAEDRVFPVILPQNVEYPAITYLLITDPRDNTHDGPDGLVVARYQITCWGPSYAAMRQTAEQVRAALAGFRGAMNDVTVAAIFNDGGLDLYDPEVEVHYHATDYMIRYTEN